MDTRIAIENPYMVALLLSVFAYLIYQGRIASALGGFYAASNWIFNADIGSFALLKVFAVVLACTACVAAVRKGNRLGHVLWTPQIVGTALLVAFWILSIAMRAVLSINQIVRDMLYGFLVYTVMPTVLLLIFVNELEDVREFAYGFAACATGTAIGSVLILPTILMGQLGLVLGLGGGEYLSFSFGLSIGVLFAVGAFFVVRSRVRKTLHLGMAVICGSVLIMTAARQSALALVSALAYMLWIVARQFGKLRAILAVSIVFLVMAGALYSFTDVGQGVIAEKWAKSDDDAAVRQRLWKAGWNVFLEHPITGAGLRYMPDPMDSAHNILIDILASQGLGGLMFLAGFGTLTVAALRGVPNSSMDTEARTWKTVLISIFIFTAVHSFASGSMLSEPEFFWAPFLLIQLLVITNLKKETAKSAPSSSRLDSSGEAALAR